MTKPAFPTLLKELYKEAFVKKPNNITAGFNKAGLCPLDKERVPKSRIKPSSTLIPVSTSTQTREENGVQLNITNDTTRLTDNSTATTPVVEPVTPRKVLCKAIIAEIKPTE